MPFTLAHPALAVPLCRPLKRFGVLSALIIGSMVPDIAYFIPLNITRNYSHSWLGLFWFCLPVGALCYWLFHRLLKGPLLALLPAFIQAKLGVFIRHYSALPAVSTLAMGLSLLVGSITHLLWDSFTHGDAPLLIPAAELQTKLTEIYGRPLYLSSFLQHLSTLAGFILLVWWAWRWLQTAPTDPTSTPLVFSVSQRLLLNGALIVLPLTTAILLNCPALLTHPAWRVMSGQWSAIGFTSLPLFTGALVFYACCWQVGVKIMRLGASSKNKVP